MPRIYTAFGLTIRSDFVFEALAPVADPPAAIDLEVLRRPGLRRAAHPPVDPYFDITPETQYLHWQAVGTFVIDSPDRVRVAPGTGVSDHLVSQAFLGLVISLVLERRRLLCLHAGAVAADGRAAVFLGDKGAGKSTTCGAMLARGHRAVTDDLVAVVTDPDRARPPMIRPGFSSMKLWPDSVAALGLGAADSDREIHPAITKVQKRMPAELVAEPVPMGALFVLRRGPDVSAPRADRLVPHEALQVLLRFTFMARYGETRLGRDHLALHMQRLGTVVAQVPAFALAIPEDLGALDALADTILDHLPAMPG